MDGLTLKPTDRVARTAYRRSQSGPVRSVSPTELTASQSVTATADGAPQAPYNGERDALARHQGGRDYGIDPQAQEVIYRAVDVRSHRGHDQDQKEAALKLRAYRSATVDHDDPDGKVVEKTA